MYTCRFSASRFMFIHSLSRPLFFELIEKQMEGRRCTWGNKYLSILIINQLQTFTHHAKTHFSLLFYFGRSICGHLSVAAESKTFRKVLLRSPAPKKRVYCCLESTRDSCYDAGSAASDFGCLSWKKFPSIMNRRWSFDLEIIIRSCKIAFEIVSRASVMLLSSSCCDVH